MVDRSDIDCQQEDSFNSKHNPVEKSILQTASPEFRLNFPMYYVKSYTVTDDKRLVAVLLAVLLLCPASWMRASLYENEVTLWADAAAKSPGKARVHNNVGHALKEAHRVEEAVPEFQRALAIQPDYPDALNNLATIYNTIGRRSEAMDLLRKTLSLDPEHIPAKFNVAMIYYESGRPIDALQEYNAIIRIAPGSKEAVFAQTMINLIQRQMR